MSSKPNLLVKENLVRHLKSKNKKLDEINELVFTFNEPPLLESLLTSVNSYLDAAILDTIREYVFANPDEINEKMLKQLDEKKINKDKEKIKEKGLDEYLIESFLNKVAFADIRSKLKELKLLTNIQIELGNERWERILESVSRRNCLIHNDLIANNTYFSQAGQKAENVRQGTKLLVSAEYVSERIGDIKSLLSDINASLEIEFKDRSHITAIRELWDYIFENHYPLIFGECWDTSNTLIRYKGPDLDTLNDSVSPRTICLFTAWMSFFGYAYNGDLKYFSSIFYNNAKDRAKYTSKLKYLMDAFEKINFQGFVVQVYDKPLSE